jgi:putative heme transporter
MSDRAPRPFRVTTNGRRILLMTVLWLVIIGIPVLFRGVLVPFVLAFLFAYLMEPVVARLRRLTIGSWQPSRVVAVLSVYVTGVAVVWGAVALFGPAFNHELQLLGAETRLALSPDNITRMKEQLAADLNRYELLTGLTGAVTSDANFGERLIETGIEAVKDKLGESLDSLVSISRVILGATFKFVFNFFLILMLTAFIAFDWDNHLAFFERIFPRSYRHVFHELVGVVNQGLSGAIRGQVIVCLVNGTLTFVGLWLGGVRYSFVLALVATVFTLIPIFGTLISSAPIVLVALTDSFGKGLFAFGWIVLIHQLEANVFNPKIVGDQTSVHPVLVVFALIAGEASYGLLGALFAVPVVSIVVGLIRYGERKLNEMYDTSEIG